MQLSELIEKYGDCEVSDEVLGLIKTNADWRPMEASYYYFIHDGSVFSDEWEKSDSDLFRFNKRNVYQTEEEAEFALDMYNFCKERSFDPDWEDGNQKKYFLSLEEKVAVAGYWYSYRRFLSFYYPTLQAVQEVINKYTFEELAKYYGRV